jgi:hypothetical protein
MEEEIRGSHRLVERRLGEPDMISVDQLKLLVDVARNHDIRILDWQQFGQPAIDGVYGSFQVSPEVLGRLFGDIGELSRHMPLRWEIFPRGIIDPDHFDVIFKSPSVR